MVRVLLVGLLLSLGVPQYGRAELVNVAELPFGLGEVGPSGGSITMLLRMADVHRELDLTSEQIERLRSQLQSASRERQSLVEGLVEGRVFDDPIDGPMLRRLLDEYNEQSEEALVSLLTPTQRARMLQLQLQMQGAGAFRLTSVAKSLRLTPSQQAKIGATLKAAMSVSEGRFLSLGEVNQRVFLHLSDPQQSQWQAMQGKPFAFTLLRMKYGRSRLTRETQRPQKSTLAIQ